MAVDVILGLQWGDEGKGKIVDYLAPQYDLICRFQGGPNAGHTLIFDGKKYVLHTVPSGIFREGLINLIGNGVVIDPITLREEIREIEAAGVNTNGRLMVSKKAHLILPTHRLLDQASEQSKGKNKIGSTLRGIGPTYMDKTGRNGLRVGDILGGDFDRKYNELKEKHLGLLKIYPDFSYDLAEAEAEWKDSLDTLRSLEAVDCAYYLNQALAEGKEILAEGAQGSMLDINFGTYPFVTSSTTLTAGVCIGLGLAPATIREVIGITKAYCTRVGSGPFPTELDNADGELLRKEGMEFGATTGRPRRCGWIDIPQLKYTIMLNGVTQLALTKIDVLDIFETIRVATKYETSSGEATDQLPFNLDEGNCKPILEDHSGWQTPLQDATDFDALPDTARNYILALEQHLGTPITYVSNGPERSRLIERTAVKI